MGGIPLVNVVAIVHLFFIAAFMGTVMTENLMELNVFLRRKNGAGVPAGYLRFVRLLARPERFQSELSEEGVRGVHCANVQGHFWIDLLIELPLAVGVAASGIAMAVLVDELSWLHIVKIVLASCVVIGVFFCVRSVLRRRGMMRDNPSAEGVARETWRLYLTASLWEPLLIPILFLGFWLGYHRILESIY